MNRKLTYGDFTRTGWQDCDNVFDPDAHQDAWRNLGKPHGPAVAMTVVRETWGDDEAQYTQWLTQAPVDEIVTDGLELRGAYRAWRDAWQDCAASAVKALLKKWIEWESHATIAGSLREGIPRNKSTRKRISVTVREAIETNALEFIQGAYRRHATLGGKEPCLSVGLITDYLRQAHMPEDFRWAAKARQRTWTRSVLESMRRRELIGSSFGSTARCYEPTP